MKRSRTSTQPLSPDDEEVVRNWCLENAYSTDPVVRRQARTTAVLFTFGMHPIVLTQPRYELKWNPKRRVLTWFRAKTFEAMEFPLAEGKLPWIEEFLGDLRPMDPTAIHSVVMRAGRRMGVPRLCPRALRHDVAARVVERGSISAARKLTGTTPRVLLGYALRAEAKRDVEKVVREGY